MAQENSMENSIQHLKDAIDHIEQANQLIQEVFEFKPAQHFKYEFEAYGRYGLDQLLGNGNPNDRSLFDLLNELKEVKDHVEKIEKENTDNFMDWNKYFTL